MKKFIHVTAMIVVLFSITTVSCKKDFLEVVPKGFLIATTFDDYDKLMNFSGYYYSGPGLWQPAMLMGDEVSAERTAYNGSGLDQAKLLFQWEAQIFLPSSQMFSFPDRPDFLTAALSNLYSLNTIINGVSNATTGTDAQKKDVQAQALATRAFTHFQLLNYFAKPYSATTAATDPGFPIITTAEATKTDFERGTVQQGYDAIINDLVAAIPGLSVQPAFPTRMSKPAAEAILGKVYLFMGRNEDALKMFSDAFADIARMSHPPRLYDYNVELAPGGSFLPINPQTGPGAPFNSITDVTESLLAKMSYAGGYNGVGYPNDFMTITPQTVALFGATDQRLAFYTNLQRDLTPIPIAPGQQPRLRKYGVTYSRIGIQLSELYLLRAEARARANDLAGAKADVEELRKKRMPVADAGVPANIAADKTMLIRFILDERIREFAGEGYRWFDMRRLSTDPLFANQPAAKHMLYEMDGTVSNQYTLTPERLTLKIPKPYLTAHPEMPDNP